MSKGTKIGSGMLGGFLALSVLHVWLNIGFENLGLWRSEDAAAAVRVGFLPVT